MYGDKKVPRNPILSLKEKGFICLNDLKDNKGNPIKDKYGNHVKDPRSALNIHLRLPALKNVKAYVKHRNRMSKYA